MSTALHPAGEFRPDWIAALGVRITRLVTDSRQVRPGDTFVAYPGGQVDGRNFIAQAIASGANAVIWEAQHFSWNADWRVPNLAVRELRKHAGALADHVYAQPSEQLWMVGITGTNGKTSCSHWLAQSFTALGRKAALIGTLGNGFPGALQPTANTTPDAIRVHGLLAEYVQQGAQAVAMEVSSHALEQGRVNGVRYDVALLTNLSRDHLDYHGDMSSYAAAKRRLFDWQHLKYAVVNLDDAFGSELAEQLQDAAVEAIGYGLTEQALQQAERLGMRMVYGDRLSMDAQGFNLQVHSSWGGGELRSNLLGRFNAANMLGSLAVLLVSGVALEDALCQLGTLRAVAGRMQTLGGRGTPAVVVDYAHTPDALEKVLDALHELTAPAGGKLICVFGCGGDRDRGKRPMMGKVAAQRADICIVTSDNPRSENPHDIIAAILPGVEEGAAEKGGRFEVVEDRAQAIAQAVRLARAADTVLVAGKGHEDYQEIDGVKHVFSDVVEAQRALHAWQSGGVQS
ncbi:MAG TPA: UDP-N-acetylmuramoyl-L-alanyl-D-glutamate--2,6-diaminopimelate ligase [Gallionellaceae bacterium]